jgi:hypothetical protein
LSRHEYALTPEQPGHLRLALFLQNSMAGDCDAGEGALDDFLELVHVVWLEVVWIFNTVDI